MKKQSACKQPEFRRSQALRDWYAKPVGRIVLRMLKKELDRQLTKQFGYHAVQIGQLSPDIDLLAGCAIGHKVVYDVLGQPGVALTGYDDSLPFAASSVDLVLLCHTLNFSEYPHEVLREVERILVPEGKLIIVGFNPYSLWSISRLFLRFGGEIPWCGRFYSQSRIRDWLSLLGFEYNCGRNLFHRPPIQHLPTLGRMRGWERLCRSFLPFLGAVSMMVATKRVLPLSSARASWKRKRSVWVGMAEPSTRSGSNFEQNG